jgi:hypothetical protein
MLITVKAAAAMLGVSVSMMYGLAAPSGPVPCYRISRCLRFDPDDITAFMQSSKCEPVRLQPVRQTVSTRLRPSDPNGESELVKLFRKDGLNVERAEERYKEMQALRKAKDKEARKKP